MSDERRNTEKAAVDSRSDRSLAVAVQSLLGTAWSSLRTVYYANSLSWRFLKSGTLIFFGFFLWVSSNILYSYNPDLTVLQYPMAYGFILILYGPFHHLIVLPLSFRMRRQAGWKRKLAGPLPNTMLVVFLLAVVVLGTFPAGAMMVDFQGTLGSDGSDISPELGCTKATTDAGAEIRCNLSESKGIDQVVVRSGDTRLVTDETPPFEFTISEREVETINDERKFTVILKDEDGAMIRRYTRRLSMIESE